jgi:hypothetical protein
MKLQHVTAVTAIAVTGLFGSTGLASAATAGGPARAATCSNSTARSSRLQDQLAKLATETTQLRSKLAAAQGSHPNRARELQDRIEQFGRRQDHLTKKLDRIDSRCRT